MKLTTENTENTERPTPETDAIRFYLKTRTTYDLTDFEIWENHSAKLERERDEARNKMADALQEIDLRTLDFERMKQERDEAREALMEIEDRCVDGEDACDDIQKIREIAVKALEAAK